LPLSALRIFDHPAAVVARLKALLVLVAAIGGLWWGGEALLYRTGLYYRLAEPDSNTGAVVNALLLLEQEYQPGARNVLVLGDSRVGEGIWAQQVEARASAFNVINLAVPGSTPRTWDYLLREVHRRGFRPHPVVLGTLYAPRPIGDSADWPLDPVHAAPLLGLRDARTFERSFNSAAMRERARHAVWFPALALRQDTLAAVRAPLERWHKLRSYRPALLAAMPAYPGNGGRMPELAFDAHATVSDWAGADAVQRGKVEALLRDFHTPPPPELVRAGRAFRAVWFGRIAALAARHDAALLLFPLPRGPYPALLPAPSPPDLGDAGQAPGLRALPADFSQALEQPGFFFDELHLNAAGRVQLSAALGAELQVRLAPDAR
jgi:hypothetical protein